MLSAERPIWALAGMAEKIAMQAIKHAPRIGDKQGREDMLATSMNEFSKDRRRHISGHTLRHRLEMKGCGRSGTILELP
jgi:hypothetical protein